MSELLRQTRLLSRFRSICHPPHKGVAFGACQSRSFISGRVALRELDSRHVRPEAQPVSSISQEKQRNGLSEPAGLQATSGIELLTDATPNGYKASVLLEELKDAYGLPYTWQRINIGKNTQKAPWYTALNPNGRIPTIVDHERGGLPVFEGAAILSYLTRYYDPEHRFSFPADSDDYTVCESWIAWQHGGIGPMQGQVNVFLRYAKEKIPFAVQRYVGETERLYGVLDKRLADRDFVAGPGRGKFSIADISLIGWVNQATFSGMFAMETQFPHVWAWYHRMTARPATARGLQIPLASAVSVKAQQAKFQSGDEQFRRKEEEAKQFLDDAKAKYGYKYKSP